MLPKEQLQLLASRYRAPVSPVNNSIAFVLPCLCELHHIDVCSSTCTQIISLCRHKNHRSALILPSGNNDSKFPSSQPTATLSMSMALQTSQVDSRVQGRRSTVFAVAESAPTPSSLPLTDVLDARGAVPVSLPLPLPVPEPRPISSKADSDLFNNEAVTAPSLSCLFALSYTPSTKYLTPNRRPGITLSGPAWRAMPNNAPGYRGSRSVNPSIAMCRPERTRRGSVDIMRAVCGELGWTRCGESGMLLGLMALFSAALDVICSRSRVGAASSILSICSTARATHCATLRRHYRTEWLSLPVCPESATRLCSVGGIHTDFQKHNNSAVVSASTQLLGPYTPFNKPAIFNTKRLHPHISGIT